MNDPNPHPAELQASLSIDRLCDEFENGYHSSEPRSIEELLELVDDKLRPSLLAQLLPLELDLLESVPDLQNYLQRFPTHTMLVHSVFDDLNLINWNGKTLDRFRIEKEIGRGGMGIVFLAEDLRLHRKVAIKLLNSQRRMDPRWSRRFWREARMASGLNHPNIMTVYELGEDTGTPYIACEFIDGETLRSQLNQHKLSSHRVLEIGYQIATGMAAAHAAGVIHRDLKADNVMIREDGLVKILDFGLAKAMETSEPAVTKSGAIAGTVHFMSPEQTRGKDLSSSTDVFSFGVLIYLMITGQLPFQGDSNSDIIVSILEREPLTFSDHGITIVESLEKLVFRCLNKVAKERPTFEEIADTLKVLSRETSQDNVAFHGKIPDNAMSPTQPSGKGGSTFEVGLTVVTPGTEELHPSSIRYAQSGDVNIAWQEIGSGPIDLVFVMGWVSHLDWFWKEPTFSSFLRRLATFARVILFDKRGTGLSDKVPLHQLPNLETRMDDVRAVMDAAKSKRAVLCGVSEGGPLCALFAATYPEKSIALTMIGSYSRRLWAEDYPWGPTSDQREVFLKEIAESWGGPLGLEERAPSMADDPRFQEWWASYLRMGASPGAAVALTKMNAQIDIRPILPSIQIPSLVIHRSDDRCLMVQEGRYLADKIPGAKFVELPGADHLPFVGDADSVLDEIEVFLTGLKGSSKSDCVLASVLAIQFGNGKPESLSQFQSMLEPEIALFRGNNVVERDGQILATFDGPVRSILCGLDIVKLAFRLGVDVQCGLDTGTCNIGSSHIDGPAVKGAQQIMSECPPMTVLVSSTLRNLIAGAELNFEPITNASGDARLYKVST